MTLEQLQRIELWAKITASVAVPLLIVIFGWLIQSSLSERSLKREYVGIAVSILSNPSSSPEKNSLKEWAVQLLEENAPVPLSKSALVELRTGTSLILREVKIPVPVPCKIPEIPKPKFPFDEAKKTDPDDKLVLLLAADRLARIDYERQLEAVINACNWSVPAAQSK